MRTTIAALDVEFAVGDVTGIVARAQVLFHRVQDCIDKLFRTMPKGAWDAGYQCSEEEMRQSKVAFLHLRRATCHTLYPHE